MKKVIIKGKLVTLRPLSVNDAARFCDWLSDLEVTKFLSIYDLPAPSLKEEISWIKEASRSKNDVRFAIDTLEGEHIGITSLRRIDRLNKRAEFGIIIGNKRYWGQGYGTQACKLIVDYGFSKLKLHRIYLTCIGFNIRGQKSYQKAGFKVEGRLRGHIFRNGYFHDEIQMGILHEEWQRKNNKYINN